MSRPSQNLLSLAVAGESTSSRVLAAAHAHAARHEDEHMLSRIAAHPNTAPSLLAQCATYPKAVVRAAAFGNPATPVDAVAAALATERWAAPLHAAVWSAHTAVVAAALPRLTALRGETQTAHALNLALSNPAVTPVLVDVLEMNAGCRANRLDPRLLAERVQEAGWGVEEFLAHTAGSPQLLIAETAAFLSWVWDDRAHELAAIALPVLLDLFEGPVTDTDVAPGWVGKASELVRRFPAFAPMVADRARPRAHQNGNTHWTYLLRALDIDPQQMQETPRLPVLTLEQARAAMSTDDEPSWQERLAALIVLSEHDAITVEGTFAPWWRACSRVAESSTAMTLVKEHALELHPAVLGTLIWAGGHGGNDFYRALPADARRAVAAVLLNEMHLLPEFVRSGGAHFGDDVTAAALDVATFERAVAVANQSSTVRDLLTTRLAPALAAPEQVLLFLSFDDQGGFPGTVAELVAVLNAAVA